MFKKIFLILLLGLSSCATPSKRFDLKAKNLGFHDLTISTPYFKHKIYSNFRPNILSKQKSLHVYLDGDGTPWEQEQWLAEDPTARDPLILRLMQADKSPSIILGRPCYYGLSKEAHCAPKFWTSHRYALSIVLSLNAALQDFLIRYPTESLTLIGFSGGGTLGMLMSEKLVYQPDYLITIAANLDTSAWSQLHSYPALEESLNPTNLTQLNRKIKQLHLAGENDQNIPVYIIKSVALKQKAQFKSIKNMSHQGCWECIWPQILEQLKN